MGTRLSPNSSERPYREVIALASLRPVLVTLVRVTEGRDTIVFIPAWNEEQSLPAVLDELRREIPGADVLVVDDGSVDRTAEVAREHGAEVLSFGENRGLRAAIAAGYGYAAEHGYEYCGRVDADGQHPVAELRQLLEAVRSGASDVAVGSRFATRSGNGFSRERYESSRARRLGTGLLRRSMEIVLDRPFHDATSGMYAANARAIPILARPYTSGAPEVEAVLRLHEEGLDVDEIPVEMRERTSGESKLQGKKALVLVLTVAGTLITAEYVRRRRK
jgi:glycosyltransferase involved in cell wall biosynthesis